MSTDIRIQTANTMRIVLAYINETIGRVTRCISNDDYSLTVHVNRQTVIMSVLATGTIVVNRGRRTDMIVPRSIRYIMDRIDAFFNNELICA